MKKKVLSAITAAAMMAGIFPIGLTPQQAEAAGSAKETLFSQSVLDTLKIQDSGFNHNGASNLSESIGGNFVYDSESHVNAETRSGSASKYPGGKDYFTSSNSSQNNSWYYKTKWVLTDEQNDVIQALINDDNKIQISGRISGFYDTQAGKTAGLPYIKITGGEKNVYSNLSDSTSSGSFHDVGLGWLDMSTDVSQYYLELGGTKGNSFGKDRNYARIQYPEVYIRDISAPKIVDISVEETEDGGKDFVCGDKVRVRVTYNEPVRISDYSKAFSMSLFGSQFEVVEYSDYDRTVVLETTVGDEESQQIKAGKFSLTLNISPTYIKDLAGNQTSDTVKSFKDDEVIISGLIPRIDKIEYEKAEIMNDGSYETTNNLMNKIKPGDKLYINVYLNQDCEYIGEVKANVLRMMVGGTECEAELLGAYRSGSQVMIGSVLQKYAYFDRLQYCLEVPQDAADGSEIYIDASENGGKWEISGIGETMGAIKGNVILRDQYEKNSVNTVTAITADGERILPRVYVDSKAPTITLTNTDGTAAEVYADADSANRDGKKTNSYNIMFKSDEEVYGDVTARLICRSKADPDDVTVASEVSMGAYTDEPLIGMEVTLTVPKGYDSADYDIYIETTAEDQIHNKSGQIFYLAADTKAPELSIESGEEKQEAAGRYYEYTFGVQERSTPTDTRVYYRFDLGEDFKNFLFTDNNFIAQSDRFGADESGSGSMEYYAQDGNGNSTEHMFESFYMSDLTLKCAPTEESRVGEYLPSRDIEFESFDPPAGEEYDYLVYKIGDGDYSYKRSENGEKLVITADELYDGALITYKRVRTVDGDPIPVQTAEFHALYHCDDEIPELSSEIKRNDNGNVSVVSLTAPNDPHPDNITKMEITMAGSTLDVTDRFVHDGAALAEISMDNVLEMYGLPSGEYTMTVRLTDANGHQGEYTVFENESIIVDAPQIRMIDIISMNASDQFSDETPVYAHGDGAEASMSAESVQAVLAADPAAKADEYSVRFEAAVRYEGGAYPKLSENDISYIISSDGGENWSSFTTEGVTLASDTAEIREIDGVKYAVYDVIIPLAKNPDDSMYSYFIKVKSAASPYVSEAMRVDTITDTTAPLVNLVETAVGNDKSGWSDKVDYTHKYVKAELKITEEGFYDGGVITGIKRVATPDAVDVTADYSDYIELSGADTETPQVIFKQNCIVVFETADVWGNKRETLYNCVLIDGVYTGYDVLESIDGAKYAILKNVTDYVVSAEPAGSKEITEDGIAMLEQLKEDDVIRINGGEEIAGLRAGDVNTAFGVIQKKLAPADYDIVCGIYDRSGGYETFKIASVVSTADAIECKPFTSTVTGKGNTIHAVQYLEFNKPVAQLSSEIAEELNAGIEVPVDEINPVNLIYSTELYAVLDSKTGGNVYVVDRYRQIQKIEVDTTGTEFVDYSGYSVSYDDQRSDMLIKGNSDYTYGSSSGIKVNINGNDGISAIKVFSENMTIGTEGMHVVNNMEFYDDVTLTSDTKAYSGEGTIYAADLKIVNLNSQEEYSDAVVVKYRNTLPELIAQYAVQRNGIQEPQRVIYMFYDRVGIETITEDIGSGPEICSFQSGVYYAQYMQSCTPVITVTDVLGNTLTINGPEVDDVFNTTDLAENVDYRIAVLDPDGAPVEDGRYYRSVSVGVEAIAGGKNFSVSPSGMVDVSTEAAVIFRLTDENGGIGYIKYTPPVDVTPPGISVLQNNSGSMVSEIEYSVIVSETKSGIKRVYVRGGGADGGDLELTAVDSSGGYSIYEFTAKDANEYTVCAEDMAGNTAEATAKSNSNIVGDLKIVDSHSETGITNKNVTVTLEAEDGRRIYTSAAGAADDTLTTQDYTLYGNRVSIKKNGIVTIRCTDEIGSIVDHKIAVANIDKEPAVVTCSVEPVYDETTNELMPGLARIKFSMDPSSEDYGYVDLIRLKDGDVVAGLTQAEIFELWLDYTLNPDKYLGTPEFEKLCEELFASDIMLDTTYVDVDTNGRHAFYFRDRAGNIGMSYIDVNIIDDVKPEIQKIEWSYDRLEAPDYTTTVSEKGEVKAENGTALIDSALTGSVTNQNVTVSITSNEPVIIYGDGSSEYSTTVSKQFTQNGSYRFIIADKAGNQSEVIVTVTNISKDDIYIELAGKEDIVLIEGQESGFDTGEITDFKVYKYNGSGEKEYLEKYTQSVDLGGLNIEDISSNEFDRNKPYTVRYTAWDEAGNKAEITRRVILCGSDDMMVTVNGKLPDSSNNVFVDGTGADIEINNYNMFAAVKVIKGQYNGAQMKTMGAETAAPGGKCHIDFSQGSGWYTIGVRTLYQDMYTIRVYVSTEN